LLTERSTTKFLLALVASGIFTSSAIAEVPTPESVTNLLTTIHAEKVVDVLFQNIQSMMRKSMTQALQGKTSTEQNKKFFDSYMQKIMLIMKDELSWEHMKSKAAFQLWKSLFQPERLFLHRFRPFVLKMATSAPGQLRPFEARKTRRLERLVTYSKADPICHYP
jgi:hypothetical protein